MDEKTTEQFELGATKLTSAHHCTAGAGWKWISDAFSIFKKAPGLWMLLLLMTMVINMMCRFVPTIGEIASVLVSPVLMGGVMMAAHRSYMASNAEFDDLFSGFRYRLWPLIQVGLLYMAGVFAMIILAIVISIALIGVETVKAMGDMLATTPEMIDPAVVVNIILVVMIILVMMLPIIMMYYFAPVLVMFHGVDAFAAMKLSFMACLNNAMPFLVYGLVILLLIMLSVFTLFLGLLVLIPTIWISTYIAYRDIFLSEEQELAA